MVVNEAYNRNRGKSTSIYLKPDLTLITTKDIADGWTYIRHNNKINPAICFLILHTDLRDQLNLITIYVLYFLSAFWINDGKAPHIKKLVGDTKTDISTAHPYILDEK